MIDEVIFFLKKGLKYVQVISLDLSYFIQVNSLVLTGVLWFSEVVVKGVSKQIVNLHVL
jgi:hypothetical protein